MKAKAALFLLSAVVILLATPETLFAAEELEWQWMEGDSFIYEVKAKLAAKEPRKIDCEIEGAIYVDGRREDMATFKFRFTKNKATDNTGTYETPAEVLQNASVVGYFDSLGYVTDIDNGALAANIGQYIAAWFPPLRGKTKVGETWDVNIPRGGKIPRDRKLSGTVRYEASHEDEDGNRIAVLKFSFSSGRGTNLTRTINGTARFDVSRGRYVSVKRTLVIRGTRRVRNTTRGKGGAPDTTNSTVPVDEVRTAECVLVSSPDNPHEKVREHEWIESLKKRLEKNPADTAALLDLASLHIKRMEMDEAKKYLKRALAITDNLEARVSLGQIYLNEGDLDSAEKQFKAVLEKDPKYLPARLGLGHVHFKRGDYKKAVETADTVLKEHSKSAGAHYLKGLALGRLAAKDPSPDFTEATRTIGTYIKLDPTLSKKKRKIEFTSDGALKVLVEAAGSYRFTEQQLIYGRQLVRKVLAEAAQRLNISDGELVKILDFLAGLVDKKPEVLIDDFIKDRKKTGAEIGTAFAKYTRPDPGLIAKAVRGKWDLISSVAATTFQPRAQALEMLLTYADKAETDASVEQRGEIYLFLAAAYLNDAAANREKLDLNLRHAREHLQKNSLPWLLSAHLALLDKHVSGKRGGGSMEDYLKSAYTHAEYNEFRSDILAARMALLEQTKFPKDSPPNAPDGWKNAILLSTAASWQPDAISDALRIFLRNLLSLSRSFRDGTNSLVREKKLSTGKSIDYCIKFAVHGRAVSRILKKNSNMVELSLEARSFEEEFLKTLVRAYRDISDDRNAEYYRDEYSKLHKKQRPYFHAVERYSEERDRALGVMPISEPGRAAERAAEIIAGERLAFERAVEAWLSRKKVPPEKPTRVGPLGPAGSNPFGPGLPGRKGSK